MKTIIFLLILIISIGCNSDNGEPSKKSLEELIIGTWIHSKDSLSSIQINGNVWFFKYHGELFNKHDKFQLTIVEKLPEFVKDTIDADFIILTNQLDTMRYEILTLNNESLSVMHFPSGQIHLYNKKGG